MPDIFTEQERPYLSRKKQKKDWTVFWLVLIFLFGLALIVDVGFKWTTVHAEVPQTLSDKVIYQDYDNQTKELCTNYLNTH